MADELIYKPKLDPRASKFALKLRRSRIHRFGVFALEDISRRKRVIEYTGERISRRAISRRLEGEFTYIFMLDSYWVSTERSTDPGRRSLIIHANLIWKLTSSGVVGSITFHCVQSEPARS